MVILERSNRLKNIENKFNASIKDLFYQMHWLEDMKHRDIGLILNMPRPTVTKWFHRFKVPVQSCRRFTDKNLTSWLYKTGKLKNKIRYEGPDRRIQRTKQGLNVDFFKKWSSEMTYVLGYFCADGGMFINSGRSKYIHFVSTDYDLLEKIKHILKSRHKIAIKRKASGNWKTTHILQIGSKEIYDDLIKLRLKPNKELRLSLPDIPDKYLRHFVRGYFDGDGCVSYGFYKRKNRKSKTFALMVRFSSGTKGFLKDISRRIALVTDLGLGYLSKNGKNFNLTYNKNKSVRLFRYMYYNVSKEQYLKRKYNKFQEAFRFLGSWPSLVYGASLSRRRSRVQISSAPPMFFYGGFPHKRKRLALRNREGSVF